MGVLADGAHRGGVGVRHASSIAAATVRRHGMIATFRRDPATRQSRRLVQGSHEHVPSGWSALNLIPMSGASVRCDNAHKP
jgi:hypothetical protein